MRSEGATFRLELAYRGQGEYLETAAVGKDRTVPVLEFVKSAGLAEHVQSGTQVEMISVAEYDLGSYIFLQIPMIYALDGPYGPDGHENRGMYRAMIGFDQACAGSCAGVLMTQGEFHLPNIVNFEGKPVYLLD